MTSETRRSLQGQVFNDYPDRNITLYFATCGDADELCNVVNWAYNGKSSKSASEGHLLGWVNEAALMKGARTTTEMLQTLVEDSEHSLVLVAKLKTPSGPQIVGCTKITLADKNLQVGDDEMQDRAVEYGLNAVDPEYQSQGIGTLLYHAAMRAAKEHFHAQRVYSRIISTKRNQIEWRCRQGFVETGRLTPYPRKERLHAHVDPATVKFSVLTKRLE